MSTPFLDTAARVIRTEAEALMTLADSLDSRFREAIDLILTALALLVAGGWFYGGDVAFSLIVVETNWWLFTLLTLFTIELPLFLWFAKKHDISLTYDPDKDE